jgi:RNA polymerase subunit RPABC4/transcription elongation factor Spt4
MESEWKKISTDRWTCPNCGVESGIRQGTKRKVCKSCHAIFTRDV